MEPRGITQWQSTCFAYSHVRERTGVQWKNEFRAHEFIWKERQMAQCWECFYLHVCVCECMVHMCMCWRSSEEGVRPSGTGVAEDCEPPIVGGGNWTGVLGRAASILNVVLSLLPPEIKDIRRWWISVAIREVYIIVKMRLLIILEFVKKISNCWIVWKYTIKNFELIVCKHIWHAWAHMPRSSCGDWKPFAVCSLLLYLCEF